MHFNSPFTMIPSFVQSTSASSITWVVKMILDCLLIVAIDDMTSHMNLLASGSIPVEGSSKNIVFGFPKIKNKPNVAIAVDSFLLFPPDNDYAYTFLY